MEKTRLLLDEVMAGHSIGHDLWVAAVREVDAASRTVVEVQPGLTVVSDPTVTADDRSLMMLGKLFLVTQSFMLEMRKKEAFQYLAVEVADILIEAKQHLLNRNFEPGKLRQLDGLKLRPITYTKP